MTTYISPIGFNTTSVTRALLNHGIDSSDVVVLIRPEQGTDDNRGTEAIADVERLLQEIESNVSVGVEQIPHDDFESAVIQCSNIIQTAEGSVVVSLSGGARDVLLPLTVATISHERDIESTLGYSDLDGQVREWPLPNVTATVSDGARETLATIDTNGSEVSIPELTEQFRSAKSTITRHVNALENEGLVTAWMEHRTKFVSITLAGRLYLARTGRRGDCL